MANHSPGQPGYYRYMSWDPLHDLVTMHERLESLFGAARHGWVPPADLTELPDRYVLTLEVPGLQREDVAIEVRDGSLLVRGERPAQPCCPERYQQLERGQGKFSRSFRFSEVVSTDRITADLADGVLTVTVPKAEVVTHRLDIE
jgi:HSP20 family protein